MRPLLGSLLTVALSLHSVASIPKERPADLVRDSAPAACNAFGLTPQAAARERRERARRELEARDAMRTAQKLRSIVSRSLNPLMPAGATPPSVTITAADLVRASAATGLMVTSAVIQANEQLNARKYYFYDPEGHLLAETETTSESSPAIEWEYVWFGDAPIAPIHAPTSEVTYYFTDHLGTPIIQTNRQGQVIWHAEYDPFGRIFAMRVGDGRYQPLRLPGQIADIGGSEPDVYYNVHRYYRSSWARYTQPDPLSRRGDPHPYLYALGNPLRYTDPTGERSRVCCTPIVSAPPVSYFSHCFVHMIDDDTGAERTFSLHNMGGGWGCTFVNDSFDTQAAANMFTPCGPWNEDCGTDGCVAAAHQVYPKSSSYSYLGPNSNTYASTIASQCGLAPPNVPLENFGAPGWGKAPAPPLAGKTCPSSR